MLTRSAARDHERMGRVNGRNVVEKLHAIGDALSRRAATADRCASAAAGVLPRKPMSASARSDPRAYRSAGALTRHRMTIADSASGTRELTCVGATAASWTCL